MRGGVILTLHIVCTMMASSDEAEELFSYVTQKVK